VERFVRGSNRKVELELGTFGSFRSERFGNSDGDTAFRVAISIQMAASIWNSGAARGNRMVGLVCKWNFIKEGVIDCAGDMKTQIAKGNED
jgi:hypothetical protein